MSQAHKFAAKLPGVLKTPFGLILFFSLSSIGEIRGQAANDNPTGPAGQFNGNVTTAGSYDPYTGNVTRSVTDLTVAGAVGSYGLSYSRTWNSRNAAGWTDSFGWTIDDVTDLPNGQPIPYAVHFPDGRMETFGPPSLGGAWRSSSGTRERFKPLAGNLCYLLLADGGKVEFSAVSSSWTDYETYPYQTYYSYSFTARAIIDPHGLRTTFTYHPDGSLQVTEPAGRWIRIYYGAGGVTQVQASDGRTVDYTYTTQAFSPGTTQYTVLTGVSYFNEPARDATYTYEGPNVGNANGMPLLKSCNDSMYAGPMKNISYTYATSNNPNGTPPVYGQILSENNGTTGQAVSILTINNGATRTETRGDGPSRTFNYWNGKLQSSTDFRNVSASQTYDANGYLASVTDRRGQTTNFTNNPLTGNPTLTTFPLTQFDAGTRSTAQVIYGSASCPDVNNRDANNPYYVHKVQNERGYWTTFWRDSNKRVRQVDHPNGAYETFTYNGFGQVLSHRLTNGSTETFEYDGAGRKTAYRSSLHQSGNPTLRFQYDGLGRLSSVTDALGTSAADANRSTVYTYNQRGQVTRVTRPGGTAYIQNGYNADGTLAWTADENHPGAETDENQRTRYTYDDYKRVTSVKNPLNQTSRYGYIRWGTSDPYLHTSNILWQETSPTQREIHRDYDSNFQLAIVRQAPATVDDAWSYFYYDAVGNLTSIQDPRGNLTTFEYDNRNRRTAAFAPLGQTTRWEYDATSNLRFETRPDGLRREMQYDSMNRVVQTFGFMGEGTGYQYDLAGNLYQINDAKGASYYFGYDLLNRKTAAYYPADIASVNRTETWRYDSAGNMDQHKNPAGQFKNFIYDNRNRRTTSYWDGVAGSWVAMEYDAASRMRTIATYNSAGWETIVAFGYDDANRQIWEEQTLQGYPTRRVETRRDADGQRDQLHVPGWYLIYSDHTGRGQLKNIYDGGGTPWYTFTYDGVGNLTKRQDKMWGHRNSTNFRYDQLNRVDLFEQSSIFDVPFTRSSQQYDVNSRLVARWRDEPGQKGERFGYDPSGQLRSASYNADQVWTGNPLNATRTVTYDANALNRVGANGVNENGTATTFTANPMNQYTEVGAQTPNYTPNFNLFWMDGFEYNYDAEKRLTSVTNRAQFVYDGLGRCLKRTIDGRTLLFAYDGWKPILEWDGAGNFVAWNIYGAGPDEILWRYSPAYGHLRYHSDAAGNVLYVLDQNGNGAERYTYDAFGQPTIMDWNGNVRGTSAIGNRFMFTGREWLYELGLYDYRNRMYHPRLGRFLQPDPIGFAAGDTNLFRYCAGDPVNWTDPSGLGILDWIAKLFDTSATTERVVVTGSAVPDAVAGLTSQGGPSSGWISGNSPRGMLGLLNLPSAGSSGDGGFSIRTGVAPMPFLGNPTIASQPLPGSSTGGTTFFAGISANVIPLAGGTLGLGVYANPTTAEIGFFLNPGVGTGLDIDVAATAGWVNGSAQSVFQGNFQNLNAGGGPFASSVHFTESWQYVGQSYGTNYGLKAGFSQTTTTTYILPYVAPDPRITWPYWRGY